MQKANRMLITFWPNTHTQHETEKVQRVLPSAMQQNVATTASRIGFHINIGLSKQLAVRN